MTTTPVDMMSEAWIDKIEAETKTPEQTFKTSKNMTVKKTTSSIATRGLDSFLAFQSKEFISGYQNLVTIQPLNKSKKVGLCGTQTLTLADGVPLRISLLKVQFSGTTSKLLVWLPILQWKKDSISLHLAYKSFCVPHLWLRRPQV
jgi:hypothetical protein